MQLANKVFGGTVSQAGEREDGQHKVDVETDSKLFAGMVAEQEVLLTHGDSVAGVAAGFRVIAKHGDIICGIENKDKSIYAIQFHPEVELSVNGVQMFKNFLFDIAKLSGGYSIEDRESQCIRELREVVGDRKVLVLVSGGVDSSVCAALLSKAIGPERIVALHINNGFMRARESELVETSLQRLGLNLKVIDASNTFYNSTTTLDRKAKRSDDTPMSPPLKAAIEPEQKRRIIGDTFVVVAESEIAALNCNPDEMFLAQGTLRPDLIESASALASSNAEAIKTHHNDTQLVRDLRAKGRVVEPLKEYHKDEVRALGKALGLADDLVSRQPFPGPGLAIRVICAEEPIFGDDFDLTNSILKYLSTGSEAGLSQDRIELLNKVKETSLFLKDLGNFRATALPIRTVGVQGDGRTYSYAVVVTSEVKKVPWDALLQFAKLVPRICHKVNRICYAWGSLVDGPITKVTRTHLVPSVLEQLREADSVVNKQLVEHNLVKVVAQVPVISAPIDLDFVGSDFDVSINRTIVIRTFMTSDFMTGVPAVPGVQIPLDVLDTMVEGCLKVKGITRVMYDLTAKPPGTTEWE